MSLVILNLVAGARSIPLDTPAFQKSAWNPGLPSITSIRWLASFRWLSTFLNPSSTWSQVFLTCDLTAVPGEEYTYPSSSPDTFISSTIAARVPSPGVSERLSRASTLVLSTPISLCNDRESTITGVISSLSVISDVCVRFSGFAVFFLA